jgi:hypothetical protein
MSTSRWIAWRNRGAPAGHRRSDRALGPASSTPASSACRSPADGRDRAIEDGRRPVVDRPRIEAGGAEHVQGSLVEGGELGIEDVPQRCRHPAVGLGHRHGAGFDQREGEERVPAGPVGERVDGGPIERCRDRARRRGHQAHEIRAIERTTPRAARPSRRARRSSSARARPPADRSGP